jgi:DNA polymerase III delta prime subunit
MREQFLWTEKYRPLTIDECVLPDAVKAPLKGFIAKGDIPNTIMAGKPGCGKTTAAEALCRELGVDVLKINASLNGNIDTLRNEILRFASSVSLSSDKRKMVLLDEADALNRQSTQPALRAFMEEYAINCGFILTCNYKNKLIEPLWSRSPILEFDYPKIDSKEAKQLMALYLKRCIFVLDTEGIGYEMKAVVELIKRYYPDWRMVMNVLQRYALAGYIDTGVLSTKAYSIEELVPALKDKNFGKVRQWAADNEDVEAAFVFRAIYDQMYNFLLPASIPQAVLILNEGQKADSIVADKELNVVATLTELMAGCEFK